MYVYVRFEQIQLKNNYRPFPRSKFVGRLARCIWLKQEVGIIYYERLPKSVSKKKAFFTSHLERWDLEIFEISSKKIHTLLERYVTLRSFNFIVGKFISTSDRIFGTRNSIRFVRFTTVRTELRNRNMSSWNTESSHTASVSRSIKK